MNPKESVVSPERLEAHVRALADLAPRDYANPANLDRAAGYIRTQFEDSGAAVEFQDFAVRGTSYRNVTAAFGPRSDERVVVGAHYDAAGPFPGADDNASGVAGLIELAHLLSDASPAIGVELVAYSLEEPPFFATPHMGSAVHAASLQAQGVRLHGMLSLEMIGYFTDAPDSQRFPHPAMKALYPSTGNFIGVVGKIGQGSLVWRVKRAMRRGSPLPVHALIAPPSLPGVALSDHLSYWQAGYPAAMITDTAFYRNPHYHTAGDRPELLDYRRMAMVVQGVHAAVLRLARG